MVCKNLQWVFALVEVDFDCRVIYFFYGRTRKNFTCVNKVGNLAQLLRLRATFRTSRLLYRKTPKISPGAYIF